MPYLRLRQKIPATGRVAIKLTPAQRDELIGSSRLPRGLGHLLHQAPVKHGKLQVRLTSRELDVLILAAADVPTPSPAVRRAVDVFLRYLEAQADRFDLADVDELPPSERP